MCSLATPVLPLVQSRQRSWLFPTWPPPPWSLSHPNAPGQNKAEDSAKFQDPRRKGALSLYIKCFIFSTSACVLKLYNGGLTV